MAIFTDIVTVSAGAPVDFDLSLSDQGIPTSFGGACLKFFVGADGDVNGVIQGRETDGDLSTTACRVPDLDVAPYLEISGAATATVVSGVPKRVVRLASELGDIDFHIIREMGVVS